MDKMKLVRFVGISSVTLVVLAVALGMVLSAASAAEGKEAAEGKAVAPASSAVAIAIAISVASGALGAGYAVGKVGSAAIGAASERPEIMGRALVFVVIAEGIAVWGLVGAILLVGRL